MPSPVAYPYPLSTMSVEPIGINCAPNLPAGASAASAQAWLIDPYGNVTAVPGGNISVASPTQVVVTVGPFPYSAGPPQSLGVGDYRLNVLVAVTPGSPQPELPMVVTFSVAYDDDPPSPTTPP